MPDVLADAPDELTRRVRELVAAGAWPDVVRLLEGVSRGEASSELLLLRAEALTRVGDARSARTWLYEIIPTLIGRGDRASHRRALNLLGAACFYLGELAEASDAFAAALEMASEEDDLLIFARATNNLGRWATTGSRSRRTSDSGSAAVSPRATTTSPSRIVTWAHWRKPMSTSVARWTTPATESPHASRRWG